MNNIKIISRVLLVAIILNSFTTIHAAMLDVTKLPLGDGKVSTTALKGSVFVCNTRGGAGGAQTNGSWIHGTTWNLKEKLSVEGAVHWPNAQFTISASGESRIITGNGLPVDSVTGVFPIASSDPASSVDRNPNSIKTQTISYILPLNPTIATVPICVPGGLIGIASNGVAIFNGLDAENRDAVAHEVQDVCGGHPQQQGMYHYHGPSSCLPHQNENNVLIGYALDGFGIYSNRDASGNEISTSDLDECHGMTSEVMWDGKRVSMYHYVITQDYPYTLGCFKGTPVKASINQNVGNLSAATKVGTTSVSALVLPFVTNLSLGSKGDDVSSLQTKLEERGYLVLPKGLKKGYYGVITRDAVKKFQKANSLPTTGVVGPLTRDVFNKKEKKPETGENPMMKNTETLPQSRQPVDNQPPSSQNQSTESPIQGMGIMGQMPTPPQEAITICDEKDEGESCVFTAPDSRKIQGTCRAIKESLVCVPSR